MVVVVVVVVEGGELENKDEARPRIAAELEKNRDTILRINRICNGRSGRRRSSDQ